VSRTSVLKEKSLGSLVTVPLNPRLTRTLAMVYPKEKFRSRLVNTFVEFSATHLKQVIAISA
jgi:DNA-binding transcriptional LysR family regulator